MNIATDQEMMLDQLVTMTERMTTDVGRTQTSIPFLSIVRRTEPSELIPSVLSPSFCLTLRGIKKYYLGTDTLFCHPGHYLASVIDMPTSAQVVQATKLNPYIGLRVDLSTNDIASVAIDADINVAIGNKKPLAGAFIGRADCDFLDIFVRLIKLMERPNDVDFLSKLMKREMIFSLLSGEYRHLFFQKVFLDQQAYGVGQAIEWIKENYTRSFTVEELAKSNNMSVSGLHHKFKAVTAMGPIQYQKQLRLQEARRLMISDSMNVTSAAIEVGYESSSQFNRDYRKLFGRPPHQDVQEVKKGTGDTDFLK